MTISNITFASNAAPIVVTTGTPHGDTTGDTIEVVGVLGNTAANGVWPIIVLDATHFSLTGSAGNGNFQTNACAFAIDPNPAALPAPAPGQYGHDLSCVSDLDPGMAEVDGTTTLAQALARRVSTPRGTLIDDPNYGYDITQELNNDVGPQDLARIGTNVDTEFLKDERVLSSKTTVQLLANGSLLVTTQVQGATGTFALVLQATSVSVLLLTVTQ